MTKSWSGQPDQGQIRGGNNDEKEIREYKASELRFKPKRKKKDVKLSKEELAQLKALEEKNGASKLDDE